MSNMLRCPSVGPIVGHTTPESVRVWMRGADESTRRTIGVGALYDSKKKYVPKSACYTRLRREFDRTGVFDFADLKADTQYFVRLASLTLDSTDAMEHVGDKDIWDKLPKPDAWLEELDQLQPEQSVAEVSTFPTADKENLSFLFGSCRYPGLLWATKRADRIFKPVRERFRARAGKIPRFFLMVGDQIYADKMNRALFLERADTPSEFHERYVTAFTSPNMRELLRSITTYMTLDDHEIEDNWVRGRIKDATKRALFQEAISAYMSFQWLHCPRNYDQWGEAKENDGRKLYYSFECTGYPFFVMDSRTQRIRDDDDYILEDNHLLGYPAKPSAPEHKGQIDILCEWLVKQQKTKGDRAKFIVSPSVFVPNAVETAGEGEKSRRKKCEDDAWAAFPVTRKQLLKTIVDNEVQNTIFLSGDVHCSNVAEMNFIHRSDGPLPLRTVSITSSAFYWPWSFADGDPLSFVHDSEKEGDNFDVDVNVFMKYKAYNFEQEDNFTQVDITTKEIVAQNFAGDGRPLGTTKLPLA
jgi:alkaline phosphatase D